MSSQAKPKDIVNEVWKPVPGWPDYRVSNFGRFLSLRKSKPRLLRGSKQRAGHILIEMQRGNNGERMQRFLHQLVAEIFLGSQPPNTVIRHLDGNPENNSITNLEYGTVKQNNIERHQHSGRYTGRRTGTRIGVPFSLDDRSSVRESLMAAIQACGNCQTVEISMDLAIKIVQRLGK